MLLLGLHFSLAWDGFFSYDDIQYARLAAKSLEKQYYFDQDHFAWRLGVWYPVALLYQWTGVQDWATRIWPFLVSLLSLFVLYWQTQKESSLVVLVGLGLYTGNAYVLLFASNLYPDAIVACLGLLLVQASIYGRMAPSSCLRFWGGLSGALCFGFAFMSKLSILLYLPLGVYWAAQDLFHKKNGGFYLGVLGGTLLWGGALGAFCGYWGLSWFTRFELISQSEYLNACQNMTASLGALLSRLTWQPGQMFVQSGLLLSLLFAIGTFPGLPLSQSLSSQEKCWIEAFWCLLASYYFFPSSWASYRPLCLEARHFIPLVPVAILAGIPVLRAYFLEQKGRAYIFWILFLASLYGWIFPFGKLSNLYIALALIAAMYYGGIWGGQLKLSPSLLPKVWLGLLLIQPFYQVFKPKTKIHGEIRTFVEEHAPLLQEADYILSDPRSAASADYFFQFSQDAPPIIHWEQYCEMELKGNERILWWHNVVYTADLQMYYGIRDSLEPAFLLPTQKPLAQSARLYLYDISEIAHKKMLCTSP